VISEGDGITVIAEVADVETARAAERDGAAGLALNGDAAGVRAATELPILWSAPGSVEDALRADADAYVLVFERAAGEDGRLEAVHSHAAELGLDCVVDVRDEDELEQALELVDPEIFLISPRGGDDGEALERVLELLPDVPAGKLAIAEARHAGRDEVDELERAGFDAVIVDARGLAELVGGGAPEL
jgi:indole-3-glycerol phosphate synthase